MLYILTIAEWVNIWKQRDRQGLWLKPVSSLVRSEFQALKLLIQWTGQWRVDDEWHGFKAAYGKKPAINHLNSKCHKYIMCAILTFQNKMTMRSDVNYNHRLFKEKGLVFAQRERLNILYEAIISLSFVVTFFQIMLLCGEK